MQLSADETSFACHTTVRSLIINTTLGLIALATMSLAASHAQANHDNPRHYGPSLHDRGEYGQRHGQRVNRQRIAEINARQAQLQHRIERGLHNGSITRWEYRSLMSEQQYFDTVKRDFMSDGFLTPSEFRQLENGLNTAARNIRMEKRDYDKHTSQNENRLRFYR